MDVKSILKRGGSEQNPTIEQHQKYPPWGEGKGETMSFSFGGWVRQEIHLEQRVAGK